tara:strand:- start:393 stop:719 length:327 start_codon:yes stop_codon:yes gene_type:complete
MNKPKFIYDNIEKINENIDTKDIIFYVESNNISYSKNMNGYIINISILEDKHINNLYKIFNKLLNEYKKEKKNNSEIIIHRKTKNKINEKKYKKLKLKPLEIEMLKLI